MKYLKVSLSFIARTYWLLITLMVLIPLMGLAWQCFYPNGSIAFARSGALLIAFTLTMAWHNHGSDFFIDIMEEVLDTTGLDNQNLNARRVINKPSKSANEYPTNNSKELDIDDQGFYELHQENLNSFKKEARALIDERKLMTLNPEKYSEESIANNRRLYESVQDKLYTGMEEARNRIDELSVPLKSSLDDLKREKENIIRAEFFGGIFGTLIWGYGDWVGAEIATKVNLLQNFLG